MLVFAGESDDLLDLRGGDVFRIDAADPHAFPVDFEHDLSGLFAAHGKERLQHRYDEIHRSVVVVQEYHFVHGRRLDLALLSLEQNAVAVSTSHGHVATATLQPNREAVAVILRITRKFTSMRGSILRTDAANRRAIP